jgi:hypothetical protein
MLQVKTFSLPSEEAAANEFLKTHKPTEQGINFAEDRLTVFYDNGQESDEYKIAIIRELIDNAKAAQFQQQVAFAVTKDERDNSGAVAKNRYDQLTHQMNELEDGIKKQQVKIAFLGEQLAAYAKAGK